MGYDEVMGVGQAALDKAIPEVLARLVDRLPEMLIDTLREQWSGLKLLDTQITEIEIRLREGMKADQAAKTLMEISGVGLLAASAAVATIGHAKAFKSAREFAAWVGLVPKLIGSGGKVKWQGISKRGDTYLRMLLIHGARSVLTPAKQPGLGVESWLKRRSLNVVTVALANKMARILWALLAHGRLYPKC